MSIEMLVLLVSFVLLDITIGESLREAWRRRKK